MLMQNGATISVCHSQTPKDVLGHLIRRADIFVSAVGNPDYLWKKLIDYPKVLIDVGTNRVNGKLCGDIPHEWYEHSKFYTPVPGGIGPMTRASLMHNLYMLSKARQSKIASGRK
jgi:methylenetetrahydrofolate dehydrogenase (NADP+)/methenyltetrahydrofolate cyclohydrolase